MWVGSRIKIGDRVREEQKDFSHLGQVEWNPLLEM